MSESQKLDPRDVLQQAAALAAHLERSGVQWLPKPDPAAIDRLSERFDLPSQSSTAVDEEQSPEQPPAGLKPVDSARHAGSTAAPSLAKVSSDRYEGDPLPVEQRQVALDQIDAEVKACQRCAELARCRKQTVFGEGNPSPRFVFFGEGPGADEDRQGRPFVGRAGQLLTKMIEACQLRREDVYIMNTVKCRPPGNRNPEPEELQNCREYYQRQLAILRPEYIVCLGAISSQELLHCKMSVGKLRGKFHPCFDSKALVTYHPAYLLRNPSAKKAAWEDLQMMMRDAGLM